MAETTIEAIQEKPILFSSSMVRAILEGRKTQTRRVVKPQPEAKPEDLGGGFWWRCRYVESMVDIPHPWDGNFWTAEILDCANPYGKPGTRLWVRETFNVGWLDGGKVLYRADGGSAKDCGYPAEPKWEPAIHMPRNCSRLTLEIEKVRVERVQEISEADAKAEGVERQPAYDDPDLQYESTGVLRRLPDRS